MRIKKVMLIPVLFYTLIIVGAVIYEYWLINSSGKIKAIGCEVYWDKALTSPITSIDWGVIEPSETINKIMYIYLSGNTPASLTVYTQNFNPPEAQSYMAITWNITSTIYEPDSVIPVEITLKVYSNVTGFIDFSFQTVIEAMG